MTTIREWMVNTGVSHIIFLGTPHVLGLGVDDRWRDVPYNKVLSIADAAKWLDVEFDSGFGCQDVPDFNAWSDDLVYYVHEYDGSTCLHSALRNPPK